MANVSLTQNRVAADYTIACICPMGVELAPVESMLDAIHAPLPVVRAQNAYTLGNIGEHNVVVAIMPEIGYAAAATVVTQLLNDFSAVRFGLLVGVGGGVPGVADVRLGDVVVSQATGTCGGVVQYDIGKSVQGEPFQRTGRLNKPSPVLSASVRKLDSQHRRQGHRLCEIVSAMIQQSPNMRSEYAMPTAPDRLFLASYLHQSGGTCDECDVSQTVVRLPRSGQHPYIHYGAIGSANIVLKDAVLRDKLRDDMNLLCVEMEAAGLMDSFPCLVIRGICDYADSHKNKAWQPYAAAVAAAYMKELVSIVPVDHVSNISRAVVGQDQDYGFREPVGLCLGQAPTIEREYFIGREHELEEMANLLRPADSDDSQRRLVLGGMGGIGKTQLAIAFARQQTRQYDSVFWLNATSETTIALSLQVVAKRVFAPQDYHAIDGAHVSTYVQSWLSHPRNSRWLLIFDNYDQPHTYDIRQFYPDTSHGAIVVTTRRPDLVGGRQLQVQPLNSLQMGLRVLETRSERFDVMEDADARRLAERLAGLPLALATTGTFLRKSTWSYKQYLDVYEKQWRVTTRTLPVLLEYQDRPEHQNRTLYTTWIISFDCLIVDEPDAAELLKLLAYFDHQAIWYDLLHAGIEGATPDEHPLPDWLRSIAGDSVVFEGTVRILVDYCFVEAQTATQTYSIHACVHDWILHGLNTRLASWSYWYAFDCVARLIVKENWDSLGQIRFAKLMLHALRLMDAAFIDVRRQLSVASQDRAEWIANLLRRQDQLVAALSLQKDILALKENALGPEHGSTLNTMNNIGILYNEQGKLVEAEQMHTRVLAGYEKLFGPDHTLSLRSANNIGILYDEQGRFAAAEQIYIRALTGYEKILGPDHSLVLDIVTNVGVTCWKQGKLAEAEQMYTRALTGYKKTLGPDHAKTLNIVGNIGIVYSDQGKLVEAEQVYTQALIGYEKLLGPDHSRVLDIVTNVGASYWKQGKLAEAEQMYTRALAGYEKTLGPDHTKTFNIINNIGVLYESQGKPVEAEQMYTRALAGYKKALGLDHPDTKRVLHNLDDLHRLPAGASSEEQPSQTTASDGLSTSAADQSRPENPVDTADTDGGQNLPQRHRKRDRWKSLVHLTH